MKKQSILFATTLSLLTILINGCSVFEPIKPTQIQHYQFNSQFLENETSFNGRCLNSKYPNSLQLARNKASSPYDSFKMFYSLTPYTIDSYAYSQWASLPQITLNQLVEHQLTKSCLYRDVINSSFIANTKYRLVNQIIQLKLDLTNNAAPKARLIISSQLIDTQGNNKALKHKTFVEETSVAASPTGLAQGTATNTQKFLSDLTKWLSN